MSQCRSVARRKYTELLLRLRSAKERFVRLRSASECRSVAREKYTELLLRLRSAREIPKADISK